MSDNLVKIARHNAQADMPHYASVELIEAMADRIEELEAKLAKIESLMVHLVKFAEQSKATAGSGNSKRRGLLKTVSAVSEALGKIRKVMKGETK